MRRRVLARMELAKNEEVLDPFADSSTMMANLCYLPIETENDDNQASQ